MKTDAAKWEELANESIADAGEWKSEYRKLQATHADLIVAHNRLLDAIYECKPVIEGLYEGAPERCNGDSVTDAMKAIECALADIRRQSCTK